LIRSVIINTLANQCFFFFHFKFPKQRIHANNLKKA
jgi:hypothetical protein